MSQSTPTESHLPHLAPELWDMIISHLCPPSIPENILIRLQDCPSGDDGTAAQHHTARAWKTKIVNLAHAARSCKLLGAPATRALYSHYPGQDVAPMKKYLRTVRESPSLASLVRSATFIPWAWQHCDLKSINNYRHLALLLQACSRITALGICEPRQKGPLKDRLSVKLAPQISNIETFVLGTASYGLGGDLLPKRYGSDDLADSSPSHCKCRTWILCRISLSRSLRFSPACRLVWK